MGIAFGLSKNYQQSTVFDAVINGFAPR